MDGMFCIDFYTDRKDLLPRCGIVEKNHPVYGKYLQTKVHADEKADVVKILKRNKIRFRAYEERWERSDTYRSDFFRACRPPYRCRYCGRRLRKEYMTVDHIVPVSKTKKSTGARMLLYIQGIGNVNDVRNLAPSCDRCNKKKGDRTGLWWIRGVLGKYPVFRAAWKCIVVLLTAVLLYIAIRQASCPEWLRGIYLNLQ